MVFSGDGAMVGVRSDSGASSAIAAAADAGGGTINRVSSLAYFISNNHYHRTIKYSFLWWSKRIPRTMVSIYSVWCCCCCLFQRQRYMHLCSCCCFSTTTVPFPFSCFSWFPDEFHLLPLLVTLCFYARCGMKFCDAFLWPPHSSLLTPHSSLLRCSLCPSSFSLFVPSPCSNETMK